MLSFLPIYVYFIAISFLVSLSVFFLPIRSEFYLKLFPPFLLSTLAAETIGSYRGRAGLNNITLYNFFTAFEFCFYLWVISLIIQDKRVRMIVRVSTLLYALGALINISFIQGMQTFHTNSYAVGCLVVVSFCIYYFFELFRLPKSVKLKNNPSFWICSGLLFFYCCGFPLYGLINSWGNISKLILRNFDAIVTILNIFLYSLFTIAFLCRIKVRKYTL